MVSARGFEERVGRRRGVRLIEDRGHWAVGFDRIDRRVGVYRDRDSGDFRRSPRERFSFGRVVDQEKYGRTVLHRAVSLFALTNPMHEASSCHVWTVATS